MYIEAIGDVDKIASKILPPWTSSLTMCLKPESWINLRESDAAWLKGLQFCQYIAR